MWLKAPTSFMWRLRSTAAEHVARHVPDTDDGEVLHLDVLAELPEVAAHRLPGSPRRYAHLLVVVADGATRGEGVAEPEAVLGREAVGDVREGRRALVRRDDEVGVVIVYSVTSGGGTISSPEILSVISACPIRVCYDLLLQGLAASLCGRAPPRNHPSPRRGLSRRSSPSGPS